MKSIVRWFIGIILTLYIGTILLLNIPYIQQQMSILVARELSTLLNSEVAIGRINIGFLNRIIVDDLYLEDQSGKELLKVARLSAKFEILPLLKSKISISNVQLFGFNANMEKQTPESPSNFQFILDAFASKDTVKKETALDLRINSLLIRRGTISYDLHSATETPGKFNPRHIRLQNILANISVKAINRDSINAAIKRMSLEESNSGFELKKLTMKIIGNHRNMHIENFTIGLPNTALRMDTIQMQYDSLQDFSNFAEKVRFSCHLLPSQLTLQDISAFVPALKPFKEKLQLEVDTRGTINELECKTISVSSGSHFHLNGEISLQNLSSPSEALIFGRLSNLYADTEGIHFFLRNLSNNYQGIPPILKNLSRLSFQGDISGYFTELVAFGLVQTNLGNVRTDVKFISNKDKGLFSYSGSIKTHEFQLGKLLNNNKLGKITFNLDVDGRHSKQKYPAILLKGLISSIDYSNYTYENITMDGEYARGGFNGSAILQDPNASIQLNGSFNTVSHTPTFNFSADINHFRPHALLLTPHYKDSEISLQLRADFTGGSIDEMKGEINIDSLYFITPQKNYFMNKIKLASTWKDEQHKLLTIKSNFLKASIEGDYSYHTLPASVMNILSSYIPSLIAPNKKKIKTCNNFRFDIQFFDTEILAALSRIPLRIYTHSTLKGFINDQMQRLRVEGYFPRLRYEDKFIESGVLLCDNTNGQFRTNVRLTNRKANGSAVSLSANAEISGDSIRTNLNWGNNGTVTYSGKLAANAHFLRSGSEKSSLKTTIDILPTQAILNDTLWKIHPSQVMIDSGRVHIKDFRFSHKERYLHMDGTISDRVQDTVRLELNKINIGYVFDIANLGVNFQGEATGPAYASGLLKEPVMYTNLFFKDLGLNGGLLGDAHIHGEWHHNVKGIFLDAHIKEKDIARSHVSGYIYPIKPTSALDLEIEANNTNLKFIHYYMNSITPEFMGRATGHVRLYGKFKALTMQGHVQGDASMKVEVLNTTFFLKDSILIEPQGLTFKQNRIYDTQGNEGRLNGTLRYDHFKNLRYNFQFNVNNMLVMNTKESPDFPFYGTIYGTGNATIAGTPETGVNIDVAMTTNRKSTFTYIKDYVSSATNNQFIKFIDKTPRRAVQDTLLLSSYEQERQNSEEESDTDIRLNLLIDATPDASMKIIMDPIAGDYISGRGTGNIRTEFYNKGDVKMFGSYRINQGVYKFSLQEIIRKDFSIKNGSTITFNGAPLDATLDINASYMVNSASLNDLIANASTYVDQTNVKVDCIMNLTGQLTSPDIKLSLELPNERDEVQALVRNYIPTDEQMNMQILYLLSIGKFYTPENVEVAQNSNMMSSVLSSTLSGQLNNALAHIINSNNWNFGTNFSTGEKGWTDMEFETMLSGQLLNNRLLINGNFGYRENPLANTNFVGDFEAEWLVNRSGDIRLKAYNETNDRYYTRTNMTTQGIGIIFKKDFNKWNELFFWNRWRLKKTTKKEKEDSVKKDGQ